MGERERGLYSDGPEQPDNEITAGTGPTEDEMDTGTNDPHPEWCSCPHCREGTSTGDVPDPSQTEPDWSRKCIVCGASPVMPITEMCGPCTFGEAETAGGNW